MATSGGSVPIVNGMPTWLNVRFRVVTSTMPRPAFGMNGATWRSSTALSNTINQPRSVLAR